MTDFLTRIAQRALGVAPVVQPVVGSRYAPTLDLSVPAIFPPEDRRSENPAKRTPGVESLSAHGSSSSNARQIIRRGPSFDAVETDTAPFEASASPTQTHLDIQSPSESEREAFAGPAENAEARGKSPAVTTGKSSAPRTELQQPSAQTNDVGVVAHDAGRPVNSGAVIPREDDSFDLSEAALQREDTESASVLSLSRGELTIDAKPASQNERDPVDSPAIAHHEEEGFEATDSRLGMPERELSALLTPPLISDPSDHKRPSVDGLKQSLHSEQELDNTSRLPSRARTTPSRGSANLFNQSITRSADQQLPSSNEVGDAHASSEKIIRITIGRIDVRAVAPPLPTVEPPAPSAPKLSLDEFLQQDNRRRR